MLNRDMRDAYRAFMEEHVYAAEPALAREDEAADALIGRASCRERVLVTV